MSKATQQEIVLQDLRAIAQSDYYFAWIDSPDAHGTIFECGFAEALGVPTFLAFSNEMEQQDIDDMWFIRTAANQSIHSDTPQSAWDIFEYWARDWEFNRHRTTP